MTIAGAFLLGGCSGCKFHYSVEDKREELGLAASVTYHANGADAKFGAEDTELILYFAEDAVALKIGTDRVTSGSGSIPALTHTNYTFIGWSSELVEVTEDVTYFAVYKTTLIPPPEQPDGLQISPSVMKLIIAFFIAVFMLLLVVIPSGVLLTVTVLRERKKFIKKSKG